MKATKTFFYFPIYLRPPSFHETAIYLPACLPARLLFSLKMSYRSYQDTRCLGLIYVQIGDRESQSPTH